MYVHEMLLDLNFNQLNRRRTKPLSLTLSIASSISQSAYLSHSSPPKLHYCFSLLCSFSLTLLLYLSLAVSLSHRRRTRLFSPPSQALARSLSLPVFCLHAGLFPPVSFLFICLSFQFPDPNPFFNFVAFNVDVLFLVLNLMLLMFYYCVLLLMLLLLLQD
jgi:hypothetical protein